MSIYNYHRRASSEVKIGDVVIGAGHPIALQSMTNTNTNDTQACVAQCLAVASAGGDIVRLTTQGVKEASNMAAIKNGLIAAGCNIPIVADVHFNPAAAYRAAETSDKVRINPGNFVDAPRTFRKLTFTEEEYREEIEKIRKALKPLITTCKDRGVALRLGVNHGSLSDRIMSRYGDTPAGMVESAMEFLRVLRDEDFNNVAISIKSSNTVVMAETVRLLAQTMKKEGMAYPLHLGVTEAGDGEDGRVKSAVGIGTLLALGLGDTIRVSLSEPPENEIPVALVLRDYIVARDGHDPIEEPEKTPPMPARDFAAKFPEDGKAQGSRSVPSIAFPVLGLDIKEIPDSWHRMDAGDDFSNLTDDQPIIFSSRHRNPIGEMASFIDRLVLAGHRNPVILSMHYPQMPLEELQVKAAADLGTLLMLGYGNGVELTADGYSQEEMASLALGILQAARLRVSKTEFISCPSCGRTLFDLQTTLKEVKEATSHLTGLKIGVMGCIVNGPGEMADADYGYVGAGPGRVSLYKGKELQIKNIPSEEALDALINLIKENGDWHDPE